MEKNDRQRLLELFDLHDILYREEHLVRLMTTFFPQSHAHLIERHQQVLADFCSQTMTVSEKWLQRIRQTSDEELHGEAFLERVKRSAAYFEASIRNVFGDTLTERQSLTIDHAFNDALADIRQAVLSRCYLLAAIAKQGFTGATHVAAHTLLGRWGEEVATAYLREKGYTIVERDWPSQHRDLDIVALDGDTVVFVEVKTRSKADYQRPEESVGYRKQHYLSQTINHYLQHYHIDRPWRFDVIAIVGTIGSTPTINHIEDFALNAR